MHAFDVLGDPVRRRILELLAEGEQPAGGVGEIIQREFAITQAAVSIVAEKAWIRSPGPKPLVKVCCSADNSSCKNR